MTVDREDLARFLFGETTRLTPSEVAEVETFARRLEAAWPLLVSGLPSLSLEEATEA